MKRKYALLAAFSLAISSAAQVNFHLDSNGDMVNVDGNKFAVVDFAGVGRHELYEKALLAATVNSNSVEGNIHKVEDKVIVVNGVSREAVSYEVLRALVQYSIVLQVSDGKLKITPTVMQLLPGSSDTYRITFLDWFKVQKIYGRKGNINEPETVAGFDRIINSAVQSIIDGVKNGYEF